MTDAARAVVNSNWTSPAIFAGMAVALVAIGLYLVVWASLEEKKPYLRTLSSVLALISLAFGGAMIYEAAALWTSRFMTISAWAHAGFVRNPIPWVAIYSGLLLLVGTAGTVFTQFVQSSDVTRTGSEVIQGLWRAVLFATAFGIALVLAALAVTTYPPLIKNPANATPGFSWWVLYVGGATFGAGALLAWAFRWHPYVVGETAPPQSMLIVTAHRIVRPAHRIVIMAQPIVRHERASAIICGAVGIALFVFSLFMLAWGTVHRSDYLWPLSYVLSALSVAFGAALVYNAIALWRGFRSTISELADHAFSQHRVTWVALFAVLLFGFGLLATHFTRVASFVSVETTMTSRISPMMWSVLFALATLAAVVIVVRAGPRLARTGSPLMISWWVISAGGIAYSAGALVAWATNWAP